MEILQTIWSALSSENNIAMTVISIPMTFIEVTLTFLIFSQVLNISYTKKQGILYVVSFSTIAILSNIYLPAQFYSFINILFLPILVYFILKTNSLKAILAEVVVYTLIFIIATPLINIFSKVFNIYSMQVSTIPIYKTIYSTILYIIMAIIFIILKKHKIHISFLDKFDTNNYNIIIINLIVGIISIALLGYIECLYIDYLPNYLVFMSLFILLLYFSISMYSLFRTNQLENTKEQLATEKTYNSNLTTLHDNIRGFKHDFNNMVQAIRWISFNR